MAHTIHHDREERLVRVDYAGQVDLRELLEVIEEIRASGGLEPGSTGLSDFRGAKLDLQRAEILPILEKVRASDAFHGVRWALITDDPAQVAVGLIYQFAAASMHRVELFSSREEAMNWLSGEDDSGGPCHFHWIEVSRLLVERFEGRVHMDDIIALKLREIASGLTEGGIRGITDMRFAQFDFGAAEIRRFIEWVAEHPSHMIDSRWALVVDDPKETGLTMLYQQLIPFSKDSQVFSTLEATIEWLGLENEEAQTVRTALHRGEGRGGA